MDQNFLPEYRRHLIQELGTRGETVFGCLLGEHRKIARSNRFVGVGLKNTYHLDPASIIPAEALAIEPGMEVLDLCAAPGGKTLILAESLFLGSEDLRGQGRLVANEISDSRRTRLKNTVRDYIASDFESRVRVTGYDASRWGLREKANYDRILVDAPCSGDRFFLKRLFNQQVHDPDFEDVEDFRPGRIKRLAIRQYAILASAWMALRPEGLLVYSTCAISQLENDKVVAKLLKRQGRNETGRPCIEVLSTLSEKLIRIAEDLEVVLEPTEHGYLIMPDKSQGAGPIYFSILKKLTQEA